MPSRASRRPTRPTKTAKTTLSVEAGSASASSAPSDAAGGAKDAETKGQAEIADAAAPQREASRNRRRQDHEQRGRLGGVLREADGQREERNDDRPASDPEQPRGDARDDAESNERE